MNATATLLPNLADMTLAEVSAEMIDDHPELPGLLIFGPVAMAAKGRRSIEVRPSADHALLVIRESRISTMAAVAVDTRKELLAHLLWVSGEGA